MILKLNGVTRDNVIMPRKLIKLGSAIVALSYIILPIMGYMVFSKRLPFYCVSMTASIAFVCLGYLLKISWVYIFGKKAQEYAGLSDREKEMREKIAWLEEERQILKKFAGFQSRVFPKIAIIVLICLAAGGIYTVTMMIADGQFGTMTPMRASWYLVSILLGCLVLLAAYAYMIWGKKSFEFCLNCDRIKVGKSWRHLTKFGSFSHSLCDTCASALANIHARKAGDKLGGLLVKKGIISTLQLKKALDTQKKLREKDIGTILYESGVVDEDTIAKALNEQLYLMENGNSHDKKKVS